MASLSERFLNKGSFSVCTWFVINITTVILNKWLYTMLDFHYPFTLTLFHMMISALCGYLVLKAGIIPSVNVTWSQFVWKIIPLSFIFVVNIILGNVSLVYVPVSFMQTVKSSVPFFTYTIQLLFSMKRFDSTTALTLLPVVVGVALATWTEVNFQIVGFMCALIASVTTAVQSIVGSVLLTGQLKLDSVNLIYWLAPPSVVFLLPFVYAYEYEELSSIEGLWTPNLVMVLVLSSVIAFALNFSVFFAIKHTSALSFTVAGNFKVVLTIAVSWFVFRNQITFLNLLGISITVVGCWLYNAVQYSPQAVVAQKNDKISKDGV